MNEKLDIGAFRGVSAVPALIASAFGMFDAVGLDVSVRMVKSSAELRERMRDGSLQIAQAAPDNFVVWADTQALPIVSWLGGTSGPLELVARATIPSVAALTGCTIAVDAKASGFVSILRSMLALHDTDIAGVRLVEIGATGARWQALATAEVDATMLTMPWLVEAHTAGYRTLADRDSAVPALQTSTGASLRGWLDAHPDTAAAYYRAVGDAVLFARDRRNHAATGRVIAGWLHTPAPVAEEIRAALCAPRGGWPADGAIDPAGFDAMCTMLRSTGHRPAEPAAHYYTGSVRERAAAHAQ